MGDYMGIDKFISKLLLKLCRIDQIMDSHVAANMNACFFSSSAILEQLIMLLATNHGVTTQDMSIQPLMPLQYAVKSIILSSDIWNYTPIGLMCLIFEKVCMRELLTTVS